MPAPDDLHEWVSFEDPEERRTWLFDVTFLTSPWTCIFGRGCQGVLTGPAPELVHGCCSYGAHFVDEADVETTRSYAERLRPDQWQFRRAGLGAKGFLSPLPEGGWQTRLVDGACIFLNRPGFPAGAGCALHVGALQAGERPLDWKPDVCWQLPLRRIDTVDDDGYVTSTIREWKRRDWGEGGQEFAWWCTEEPDAFVGALPVWKAAKDDLIELTSEAAYQGFVTALAARGRSKPLPHPAVRRRASPEA